MRSLIGPILVVIAAAALADDCADHSGCKRNILSYYKELHCQPIHEPGTCCPTRFDCSNLSNRPQNQCHTRGASYNIGDRMSAEQLHYNCAAECSCAAEGDDNSKAELRCAHIECPEMLGVPAPPGCKYIYSHDACCATGTVCTNETTPEPFKCQHEDHAHHLGEQFYPDDTCLKCICQEGYDGTSKEPWCRPLDCGLEIHYGHHIRDGCAPVYQNPNSCCPSRWRCPSDTDIVEVTSDAPTPDESHYCVFGKLRLKVNETLNSDCSCEECTCLIPPHLTCVQTKATS